MGNYTQLYIGNMYLSWNNQIPDYLAFIYDESDYFITYQDNGYIDQIGYKTTRRKAISRLEQFGYSIEFCVDIYTQLYKEYFEIYLDDLKNALIIKNLISDEDAQKIAYSIAESFPHLSRLEEYQDFLLYLDNISKPDYKNPTYDGGIKFYNGKEYPYSPGRCEIKKNYDSGHYGIDFSEIKDYLGYSPRKIPPHLYILNMLFLDEDNNYTEIVTLIFLRTVLELGDKNTDVILDFSDILRNENEVKNLLAELPKYLIEKISLYNKVFHVLFQNKEEIQLLYAKKQCKQYFTDAKQTNVIFEKGKNLENLVELLFTWNASLELINKRVSTGDEEIDLIIKNNINRPFWLAFNSPLFFIECKNWSNPIGTNELRNFEVKIQNHSNLVKVGFFIATNGFTKEVFNELRRIGRDNYHVILIDGTDIDEFLSSKLTLFSWLEKNASKIY